MPDGDYADDALAIAELVDDPARPDAQRPQSPKPSSQHMSCLRLPFEKAEGLEDSIRQRPVEVEDLLASPPDELDPAQLRLSTVELPTELVERHGLSAFGLPAPLFDRGEGTGIGQDLGGLL